MSASHHAPDILGVFAAIFCGFGWSLSIILWKKIDADFNPILINLGKNVTGFLLFIVTVLLFDRSFPLVASTDMWALLISGFIGIGIADALVLRSIHFLPASNVALLETLYSPFIIGLAIIFLGDSLSLVQCLGIALILGSVIYIQQPGRQDMRMNGPLMKGLFYMVTGLFCMAIGVVLMKPVLHKIPLLWVITIRMAAGVLGSVLVFLFVKQKKEAVLYAVRSQQKLLVFSSFVVSAYMAIIFWIMGFKLLEVSLSAVLNQLSTIFTVLMAAMFLGERLTLGKVMATVGAVIGVVIISA